MNFEYQAFMKVDRYDILVGDQVEIVWQERTPNGGINFNNGRTGDNHTLNADLFHRIFRKLRADEL